MRLMVRTQIYRTEKERTILKQLAEERCTSQSALIREAVDLYLESHSHESRRAKLRAARGIWKDRDDFQNTFRTLRERMDRDVWDRDASRTRSSDG